MNSEITNITLEQLNKIENLTVRTVNICKYSTLNTLKQIVDYYNKFGDFKKLRYCGKKSDDELIKICKKYEKNFPVEQIITKDELQVIIENLNIRQKTILNSVITTNFNRFSARAYNALSLYLNTNFSLTNIYENIFADKDFNFKDIKNIGEKTIKELELFKTEILEYIKLVSLFGNEDELETEYCKAILTKYFPDLSLFTVNHFVIKNNQIQIFNLIDQLLTNGLLFDKRDTLIFTKCFDFFSNFEHQSLDELTEKLDISRERVRQLREKIYDEFYTKFDFLLSFDIDFEINYAIPLDNDINFLSNQKIDEINLEENTNYNVLFIHKIIHLFFAKSYSLIGNERDMIFHNDRRFVNNWNSTYIIKKELCEIFDFSKLADDIFNRLNNRKTDTYSFYFGSYLLNFYKIQNYQLLPRISKVCEILIFSEFDLVLDLDDNIVFQRNIKKQNYEIAKEILHEAQSPLKVEEIYQRAIEKYPDLETTTNSIAVSMGKNAGFIFFGRSSTYGLQEWEKKYSDIKGGSIREIVEEFLIQFDEPKQIEEITQYVCKYRKTSLKSISSNIRMEENNRFIFFKYGFVGLKAKNYGELQITKNLPNNQRQLWEDSYIALVEFIKINERFPNLTGEEYEKKLCRFCSYNKSRYKINKLTKKQVDLLVSINFNFENNFKNNEFQEFKERKRKIDTLLEELINFRKVNPNSWPQRNSNKYEDNLYYFCYRIRNKYKENKLSKDIVSQLNTIGFNFSSKKASWIETYRELKQFISDNNRLPKLSKCEDEKRLYYFYYNNKMKYKNGILEEIKSNYFKEVLINFEII